MKDRFEGRPGSNPDHRDDLRPAEAMQWSRLEEIGDLHFHASAFSSALDYYGRLLGEEVLDHLPLEQATGLMRKSVRAALNLGRLGLAESLLQQAGTVIDAADAAPDELSRLRAVFQSRWADLLVQRGSYQQALDVAKHAFACLAVTDEHTEVADLQVTMGACHQRLGRLDKAEEFFTDSLATFRRVGDELGTAALYNNLALLHKNGCRWDRALDLMDRAIVLAYQHGATHLLARLHLNQGIILNKTGRLAEARIALEKSHRLSRSLGDRLRLAKICLAIGRLELLSGRLVRAEELILEGKILADEGNFLRESTIADEYLGDVQLARRQIDKALFNYGLGLEKARSFGKVNDLEGELLRRTADAQRQAGNFADAIASAHAAVAVCEQCGEVYELGFCHTTLGEAYAAQNDWKQADSHFREAIAIFGRQRLGREGAEAVLAYLDARLDTAGNEELLVLRRHLLEAQEREAPDASEVMLCSLLRGLACVQMRLGHLDDALLTIFELERNCIGLDDAALLCEIGEMRDLIETGLLHGIEKTESQLEAISLLPGLFNEADASVPRNLESVLQAGMERTAAGSGFVAMCEPGREGERLRIVARTGMTDNLCGQIARWFVRQHEDDDGCAPCLYSRLRETDDLAVAVPALIGPVGSCVIMPIAMHGQRFGMLFVGKSRVETRRGAFAGTDLDFLATYLGFLALFLWEKGRAARPAGREPTPLAGVESFENVITQNELMLEVLALARKVAPSDLTVLLNGETGTGKGLLAYAIHALSRRSEGKFLTINCAAIPETLLESELFGHAKGSFTGADSEHKGLLVEAESGTVFLDEIGKMSLAMQGKLLQFLDTKIVRPVGSVREHRIDVRIICASKADLQQLAADGLFLDDLYFRLLDFPLTIPPLRARRDDIELLARHFIGRFVLEMEQRSTTMGPAFLDALLQHDWPGNIRELEKCLKRAIVLAEGDNLLRPEHLPEQIAVRSVLADDPDQVVPLRETIGAVECREIAHALKITAGNKSHAARLLKISYPSLLKKVRHYGL